MIHNPFSNPTTKKTKYTPSGVKKQLPPAPKYMGGTIPAIGGPAKAGVKVLGKIYNGFKNNKIRKVAVDAGLNKLNSKQLLSHHIKIGRQMAKSLAKQLKARKL